MKAEELAERVRAGFHGGDILKAADALTALIDKARLGEAVEECAGMADLLVKKDGRAVVGPTALSWANGVQRFTLPAALEAYQAQKVCPTCGGQGGWVEDDGMHAAPCPDCGGAK